MENLLAPFIALSRLRGSRALVFAPHPDDEVFGCGGAICAHLAGGDVVRVIVVTDGGAGADEGMRDHYVQKRRSESKAAADVLGYADLQFWDLRDREVHFDEQLVVRVIHAINEFGSDLVYAPSIYEIHPEHRAIGMAVIEAARRSSHRPRLAMYEVGMPLRPNTLLDISLHAPTKLQAMRCFESQNLEQRYDVEIAALNTYRTYSLGAAVTAAEAFIVLDWEALSKDPLKIYQSEHRRQRELGLEMDPASLPLVSVIVRSVNRPELTDALDSLALQTYGNMEVVVVNAGGRGHRVLDDKCGRFPLRLIDSEMPVARAQAANKGLDAAHGQYLMFLDDDDWFDPDHVAKLAYALQSQPHYLTAYTGVRCVDGQRKDLPKVFDYPFDAARLLAGNFIPFHALMFSRALLQKGCRVDESFAIYEDWDFWIQLAQHGDFLKVDGLSAVYRIAGGSGFGVNRFNTDALLGDWKVYQKWFGKFRRPQIHGIVQALLTLPERDAHLAHQRSMLDAHEARIAQLLATTQTLSLEIQGLLHTQERSRAQSERDIADLNGALVDARHHVAALLNSNSWRITRPMRVLKRAYLAVRRNLSSTSDKPSLLRRIFRRLPISNAARIVIRNWVARYFPSLLVANPAFVPKLTADSHWLPESIPAAYKDALEYARSIRFVVPERPVVSVVVPVYGKVAYTLHCLESVMRTQPRTPFEVIVVNDCSPDDSAQVLQAVNGLILLNQAENRGFIRSCNDGARRARGQYVLFLNNDTEVTKGWLDEMVRTFDCLPGTGLVGSKLLYPDGRLQEAGGIVWNDGSAWNLGRNQNPLLPEYCYAREVDYCSGASIMVPAELFRELGGFDEHYLPAYYEDTDLALKIRARGLRVIYQPLSAVIHFEGVTSGTDTSSGAKAYQVVNMRKLCERWGIVLQRHQANGVDVDRAKDRMASRRVLVLDHCTPTPDQDSGSIDTYNIMLLLREMGFQVTFIAEDNFLYMKPYTENLQRVGIEVLYAPYCLSVEEHLKKCGARYGLALLIRPGVMERHHATIRKYCPLASILFHTVDLHFLRMGREAALMQSADLQAKADDMKKRELNLIQLADAATVISEHEYAMLQNDVAPEKLFLLPYARHIGGTNAGFAGRDGIVFVGGYQHTPNVDAVKYFVAEVMPLVRRRLPGVKLHVVGSKPPAEISQLAADDVIIEGYIADLEALLDTMRVSVAPLRYGAGIKGKVGTAMAAGLPVVATSIAAEGMGLCDGENVLIADDAEHFADAVVALCGNQDLWNRISHNGLEYSEKTWGASAAYDNLSRVLGHLGCAPVRSAHPLTLYQS